MNFMNFNLDELEKAATLLQEMNSNAKDIVHMLELMKELNLDANTPIIPVATDRLIGRGKAMKILNIGSTAFSTLVKNKQLTPLYIAGSSEMKFWLSEVMKVPSCSK